MKYIYLLLAIAFEIMGTSSIQASQQFTKWKPSLLVVGCFVLSFYFLSQALKSIPLGIAYAIWSAMGIVFISLIGVYYFKQKLDLPAIIGISLIIIGVLVIQLFSASASHQK